MKQIFYLLVLTVCAIAAPVDDRLNWKPEALPAVQTKLYRPSPINPDIPSDPKPQAKVTLINTDYTKKKRETTHKPVASILPATLLAVVDKPNENSGPKIENIPLKYPADDKDVHGHHKRDTLPRPINHQVTPGYLEQQQKEEELKQKEQQDKQTGETKQKRDVVPQTLPAPVPSDQRQYSGTLTREQDNPGHLTREQDKPGHLTREQDKRGEQKYYKRDTTQKLPTPSEPKTPGQLGQHDKKDDDQKQQKRQTPQTPQALPAQLPNNEKQTPGSVNQQQNDDKNNNQKQQKRQTPPQTPQTLPAQLPNNEKQTPGSVNPQQNDDKNINQKQQKRETVQKVSTPGQAVQQQKKDEPNKQSSVHVTHQPSRNPQRPQRRESPQRRPVSLSSRQLSATSGTVNQQVKKDDSVKKLRRDVPGSSSEPKKFATSTYLGDDVDDSKEDKPTQNSRPKIAQKRETDNNKNSQKSSEEHLSFVRPVPVSQIFGSRTSTTDQPTPTPATDDKKFS